MAKSAPLSFDAEKRVKIIYHEEDGKTFVETRQDTTHLIEAAKLLAEIPPDPETGLRFICNIDEATYNRAIIEGWFHDKAAWRRWASNPDNRALCGGIRPRF
jgi:hypothetical protein